MNNAHAKPKKEPEVTPEAPKLEIKKPVTKLKIQNVKFARFSGQNSNKFYLIPIKIVPTSKNIAIKIAPEKDDFFIGNAKNWTQFDF